MDENEQKQDSGIPLWKREQTLIISPCEKALARFSWAGHWAFTSHGVALGIRVNDTALRQESGLQERLQERLPPRNRAVTEAKQWYSLATVASRTGQRHFLYRGACRIAQAHDIDAILEIWESDLHGQIAAQASERLFVHAGVAVWNGMAVVIPGRSFSGKSTLTAALVQAGALYFSDEYAVFDAQGRVYPYAKTLSLRDEFGNSSGRHPVEALGGMAGTEPLRVGLVLSCRYEVDAHWRPRSLSSGRALMAMLDNTVQVRPQPQTALATLHNAVTDAQAFTGKRGEASQVIAWLQSKF